MAQSGSASKRQVGRLEWAVAGLGALIALAVFGVLGYEAATFEEGPPTLVVRVVDVSHKAGGHVVRFEAQNLGSTTAAEVVIRARLTQGGATVEESQATLDYVARRSRRSAGVVFQHDPTQAKLDIAAVSYREP